MARQSTTRLRETSGDRAGSPRYRLNDRELAMILAALRYWQRCGEFAGDDIEDIATCGGTDVELDNGEIDALCERLNCG